jgi:hypothetical protein
VVLGTGWGEAAGRDELEPLHEDEPGYALALGQDSVGFVGHRGELLEHGLLQWLHRSVGGIGLDDGTQRVRMVLHQQEILVQLLGSLQDCIVRLVGQR